MRQPEDRTLTERVNAREQAAFLELYDRFSASIYRHSLLRAGSREVAEDVVSHTFAKAWEYLREPTHKIKHCKAFLFRIAHNHLVDHWRDKERTNVSLDDRDEIGDRPFAEPSTPATAAETTDQSMDIQFLRELLTSLPEAERRIVLWRYVDELPMGEIARLSGKSMGATYVAIHRAKKLLERKVAEYRPH